MDQLLEMAFPKELANIFSHTMGQIEKADQLIAAAKKRHPDKAEVLDRTFPALIPPELLRNKHPKLYEHHVNELLERAANGITGIEFSHGTKAEALCALLGSALQAPLRQDYSALANRLFVEIFGKLPKGVEDMTTESYEGAADELLRDICRTKLRDPDRRLK
jgi:hypothetical protein